MFSSATKQFKENYQTINTNSGKKNIHLLKEREISDLKLKLANIEVENSKLRKVLQTKENQIKRYEQSKSNEENLKAQINNLVTQINSLETDKLELQNKVSSQNSEIEKTGQRYIEEAQKYNESINKLTISLTDTQSKLDSKGVELNTMAAENNRIVALMKENHVESLKGVSGDLKATTQTFYKLNTLIDEIITTNEPNIKSIIGIQDIVMEKPTDTSSQIKDLRKNMRALHKKIQDFYTHKYASLCNTQ